MGYCKTKNIWGFINMGKELSEMTLEELWELFPIILKEHNTDYKGINL